MDEHPNTGLRKQNKAAPLVNYNFTKLLQLSYCEFLKIWTFYNPTFVEMVQGHVKLSLQ